MPKTTLAGHAVLALLTLGLAAAVYLVAIHVALVAGFAVGVLGWAAIAITCCVFESLAGGGQE